MGKLKDHKKFKKHYLPRPGDVILSKRKGYILFCRQEKIIYKVHIWNDSNGVHKDITSINMNTGMSCVFFSSLINLYLYHYLSKGRIVNRQINETKPIQIMNQRKWIQKIPQEIHCALCGADSESTNMAGSLFTCPNECDITMCESCALVNMQKYGKCIKCDKSLTHF